MRTSSGDGMRRLRAVIFGVLLTGSLFPSVAGVPLNAAAAIVAAPLIAFEFIRTLPRLHPVLVITVAMFAPLLLARGWQDAPGGPYGDEKFAALWSSTLLCAAGAALIRDRAGLLTFARVWVGIGAVLAVMTMFTGAGPDDNERATGFGSNPIWLGRAIATAAVFAGWLLWRRYLPRLVGVALIALLVTGVVLTGSRGPTLGMLVGLSVLLVLAAKRPLRWAIGAAAAGAALLWLAPVLWPGLARVRALGFL